MGVPGRGYVIWSAVPNFDFSLPTEDVWGPGVVVLDGVVDDYPEFSRQLIRTPFSPPDIGPSCAFEFAGCPAGQ